MRLGFLLVNSEVAKHLRTIALDAVEIAPKVIEEQQPIERVLPKRDAVDYAQAATLVQKVLQRIELGDNLSRTKSLESFTGQSFQGDNLSKAKSLQAFMGQSFQGDYLSDVLCTAILEYYAFDAGEEVVTS